MLFFSVKAMAQEYTLIKTIPISAKNLSVDKFDNIYIIESYKISKFDKKGTLLFTYEDLNQGEISYLDVSNPLKPLVYYADFNVLNILDNKLSLISSLNLFDKNLNLVKAICSANTLEYWLYDEVENKLKQTDKNFNITNESETFYTLFNKIVPVLNLQVANNKLYVLDNDGIKVFDLYGGFKKQYPLSNLTYFQIFGDEIVYAEDKQLKSINEKTNLQKETTLFSLDSEILQVSIIKEEMIYMTENAIYIFRLK